MIFSQLLNIPSIPVATTALIQAASPPSLSTDLQQERSEIAYNVKISPNLQQSQELQAIVNQAVSFSTNKGLPKESLSITLIDVKSGEIAGYQQQQLRYPASVVKLFWMVLLYAEIAKGILPTEGSFNSDVYKMIQNSDNDAASRILDTITDTKSGSRLQGQNYNNWLEKRNQVNQFFQAAGYQNININQKVYPIGYLDLPLPQGRDLQMRENSGNLSRNLITTYHTARLLYEIFTGQSVSPEASQKMAQLLTRRSRLEARGKEQSSASDSSPVEELLFGESLPDDVYFASKAGWTSTALHEAAFVSTPNDETSYILVVFGSDRAYAQNEKFFSDISHLVFNSMTGRSPKP
ncbi:MAG: hypothetical protein NVS2B14_12880 [Chamaesiphon sp.]